jgi:hypothetical protein
MRPLLGLTHIPTEISEITLLLENRDIPNRFSGSIRAETIYSLPSPRRKSCLANWTRKHYSKTMKPISIEVVTDVLGVPDGCQACRLIFGEAGVEGQMNRETLDEYPRELKEEFLELSDWLRELTRLYKHRIRVVIIDTKSMLGVYKSVRHRFRKYPAFIVNGRDVVAGWDRQRLSVVLDRHLQKTVSSN